MKRLREITEKLGHETSGSDLTNGGHRAENVKGSDMAVYTSAVPCDNEELVYARANGIPVVERAEYLGAIAASFEKTIAVAGTHGKTTTTGMLKEIFASRYPCVHIGGELKDKPDIEKSWLEEKLDNACEWCKECWKELLIGLSTLIAFIAVVAVIVSTWPYSGLVLLLFGITISCTRSVYNGSLPPPYTYDETFPQSMSDCLGINYSDYIKTMHYQYGFDEQIAILYLKLYLQVANDPSMRGKSEREIACEFNRIIASLCINYDGDAKRWRLTTGNYKSVDAYEMLINKYGFTEADAIDFAIALNVQHGSNYENIELHFGFSREEGNLFNGENPPTVEEFKRRANELGSEVMKDFVHEALQYVEFNDNLDIVDFANGSTDRMISYSGDIISTRYDDQDFLSDIDPNNIQYKFENSNSNFLKVQQEYNKAVMDGRIDPKSEFISNNGGIDQIRNNINYDVKSTLGAYIDGEFVGEKKKRADKYKQHIDAFITFLQD